MMPQLICQYKVKGIPDWLKEVIDDGLDCDRCTGYPPVICEHYHIEDRVDHVLPLFSRLNPHVEGAVRYDTK